MRRKDLKRYSVPYQHPSNSAYMMRFVRGNISKFYLSHEGADGISKRLLQNVKARKWYRHRPRVGTHVYLKEGEILKRALVLAHDDDGVGIELLDLDRGNISYVHFLENVFYMEKMATNVRPLCALCVLSGQETFDVRCVEEWKPFFAEIMRGSVLMVRFVKSRMVDGDLLPTYEVTIDASYNNGVNDFVNVNELLRTASPGKLDLDKFFRCGDSLDSSLGCCNEGVASEMNRVANVNSLGAQNYDSGAKNCCESVDIVDDANQPPNNMSKVAIETRRDGLFEKKKDDPLDSDNASQRSCDNRTKIRDSMELAYVKKFGKLRIENESDE